MEVGQCNADFGKAFKVKSYTSNKPKISVHTISIYVHDAIKPNDSFVEHIVLVFYMVVLIICSATYVAEKPIKIGQLLPKIYSQLLGSPQNNRKPTKYFPLFSYISKSIFLTNNTSDLIASHMGKNAGKHNKSTHKLGKMGDNIPHILFSNSRLHSTQFTGSQS